MRNTDCYPWDKRNFSRPGHYLWCVANGSCTGLSPDQAELNPRCCSMLWAIDPIMLVLGPDGKSVRVFSRRCGRTLSSTACAGNATDPWAFSIDYPQWMEL